MASSLQNTPEVHCCHELYKEVNMMQRPPLQPESFFCYLGFSTSTQMFSFSSTVSGFEVEDALLWFICGVCGTSGHWTVTLVRVSKD